MPAVVDVFVLFTRKALYEIRCSGDRSSGLRCQKALYGASCAVVAREIKSF